MRELLAAGANPDQPDGEGYKAVGAAAMGGANHVIDLLVDEFGVEVDQNMLCMTLAVKHSQHATIDHLVTKHGVDPDQVRCCCCYS